VRGSHGVADVDRTRWTVIADLGETGRKHDGSTVEVFRLFRVIGQAGLQPVALLPRPR
jgi:hypothetical protein